MVQFDSVDPAALVVAIIAIIVTLEQFARASFESDTKRLKRVMVHLCEVTKNFTAIHLILKMDDADFLLLIECGLDFYSFVVIDPYSEIFSIARQWPDGITMAPQAWCIRNNLGLGVFFFRWYSWFQYYVPWVYYTVWSKTKTSNWNKFSVQNNINHNQGYSGKQFDKCLEIMILRLHLMVDHKDFQLLLTLARMASESESKYIGPCVSSLIATGQDITLGALLCDIKLLNPEGRFGSRIGFDMLQSTISYNLPFRRRCYDLIPVLEELPSLANIFRYYRDCSRTRNTIIYDQITDMLFPTIKSMMDASSGPPSTWCSINCESVLGKRCLIRGRPILIMTKNEVISMALSGKLNKKRCLIMDSDVSRFEMITLLKINNCDIKDVYEVTLDHSFITLDKVLTSISAPSFIILAKSLSS